MCSAPLIPSVRMYVKFQKPEVFYVYSIYTRPRLVFKQLPNSKHEHFLCYFSFYVDIFRRPRDLLNGIISPGNYGGHRLFIHVGPSSSMRSIRCFFVKKGHWFPTEFICTSCRLIKISNFTVVRGLYGGLGRNVNFLTTAVTRKHIVTGPGNEARRR